MIVLKWIGFILVCLDTVAYIMNFENKGCASFIGLCIGIALRVLVLHGAATSWLLS